MRDRFQPAEEAAKAEGPAHPDLASAALALDEGAEPESGEPAEKLPLDTLLDESAAHVFFHSERWRIAVALARTYAKRGNAARAATHAEEALALLADNTPKLPRHKNVGLISTDAETVKEMQQLANPPSR